MKNSTILVVMGVMILLVGGFIFVKAGANGVTGKVVDEESQIIEGELQKVTLSMKDFAYYPEEIRVKVGQPVEATLDSTVKGCGRSLAIRELGVSKFSTSPDEKISFTPTKKGVFMMTCSMGMVGPSKLIVE